MSHVPCEWCDGCGHRVNPITGINMCNACRGTGYEDYENEEVLYTTHFHILAGDMYQLVHLSKQDFHDVSELLDFGLESFARSLSKRLAEKGIAYPETIYEIIEGAKEIVAEVMTEVEDRMFPRHD